MDSILLTALIHTAKAGRIPPNCPFLPDLTYTAECNLFRQQIKQIQKNKNLFKIIWKFFFSI